MGAVDRPGVSARHQPGRARGESKLLGGAAVQQVVVIGGRQHGGGAEPTRVDHVLGLGAHEGDIRDRAVQHRVAEAGGGANRLGAHDRHHLVAHREPGRRRARRAYPARPYRRGRSPPERLDDARGKAVGGADEVGDEQRLRPAVDILTGLPTCSSRPCS